MASGEIALVGIDFGTNFSWYYMIMKNNDGTFEQITQKSSIDPQNYNYDFRNDNDQYNDYDQYNEYDKHIEYDEYDLYDDNNSEPDSEYEPSCEHCGDRNQSCSRCKWSDYRYNEMIDKMNK